jgi:hypothetical protein
VTSQALHNEAQLQKIEAVGDGDPMSRYRFVEAGRIGIR